MKDYVIAGSQAMRYHFPDFPREPKDTDVICTKEVFMKAVQDKSDIITIIDSPSGQSYTVKFRDIAKPVEYLIADGVTSLELILAAQDPKEEYLSPEVLYSLKKGHINFPIHFQKNIKDLMFLREKLRQKYDLDILDDLNRSLDWLDQHPVFTSLHFKETEKRLGELKTPKMKENKAKFFGKSKKFFKSYYVHDDMHKAIAQMHQGYPVYNKILAEGKEVETDPTAWSRLTTLEKIWCVLEEVYVIALERKILPLMFEHNSDITTEEAASAFKWALYRVCTNLCDGFFREFAVRAYDLIWEYHDPNYVNEFFKNISQYDTDYEETEDTSESTNNEVQADKHENSVLS